MKKSEAIISSLYTGTLFPGVNFSDIHELAEERLGREIPTHEFRYETTTKEISRKFKDDFIKMEVTDD
jgi:hypothetical protein